METQTLKSLDDFRQWVLVQEGVAYVGSISEVTKALNQTFQGGDPDAYQLPDSGRLAANYLMVYDMSIVESVAVADVGFARLSNDNTRGMLWGTFVAFVIISAIITVVTLPVRR